MARKTFYLIDGHAQIYRAYYARFGALTSPAGEPTRAVHVFLQMLLNILRDRQPDYLAMAMDVSDKSVFRVQIDPKYKANRESSPEDLGPQIDRIVSILQAIKIPILRETGYEADDIMATLAHRFAAGDLEVILVSKDKDLDQLLGDHVRMYDPGKNILIDADAMFQAKGYRPDQAVEAQMLMGDSTDNIKGVVGVGPKKAAQLIQKYGTVENIIAHANELTPKLRDNILAFRERMETVRQLVTLRRDMEIDFDLCSADVQRFDPSAAGSILADLGLNRLLERVGTDDPTNRLGTGATDRLSAATQLSHGRPARDSTGETPVPQAHTSSPVVDNTATLFKNESFTEPQQKNHRYELIDTDAALAAFAKKLAKTGAFAFDTETNDRHPAAADLVGLSFSFNGFAGCYIPVRGIGRTVSEGAVRKHLGPILADPAIRKCGQNLKYDLVVLMGLGLEVRGIDFDSMIASFLLDPARRSHGIDALANDLLQYRKIATTELIGKGKQQTTFDKLPTQQVCDYAAEDADIAWRLREVLDSQLTEPDLRSLFTDVEIPLIDVLAEMEYNGVALDTDRLADLSGRMADRMAELEREIHTAAGHPFNINSTQQLGSVLFDELGLRIVKRTKTGRSTDAEVLAALVNETDLAIPRLVLEHRELAKLKGTYIDALPEMLCRKTDRIHPSFRQTGTVTGRLSCSDPNLQNIPIRTEMGAQIRRAFVPRDSDWVLVKADYSQIELRVLAHFSGDAALREAFAQDRDIHAFVAAQLADVPLDQITREQRSAAKTVNFGIVYGQSPFGLARQTGMSLPAAKAFIERYFQRYPKIRGFLDQCVEHARRHGYVKTLLGRRRAIPEINSRNQTLRNRAERFAANTVIQGTAADLIKRAMVNIHRRLHSENRPSRMLIQVHDELVFEMPRSSLSEDAAMIDEEMSSALPLDVPIKVDLAAGENWLDVKPVSSN